MIRCSGKTFPKRYEHSIAVMERAVELAKRYGVDVEKSETCRASS